MKTNQQNEMKDLKNRADQQLHPKHGESLFG